MPFVMRLPGYSYGGEDGPGEHIHDCYLTADGQCSRDRRYARVYATEAEAWEHLRASGETVRNDELTHFYRTEEIT